MIDHYQQRQEQAVVDLWNKCCTFDPISIQKFRLQTLLDDNFDPSLAFTAVEEGKVIGFGYGTKRLFPYMERGLEPDRGWINVLFVDPEYQNQGIGKEICFRIENQLKQKGAKNCTLGAYSPNYYFYGVDPVHYPKAASFFAQNGYTAGEEFYSMGKNLHGFQIPNETLAVKKELEELGYSFEMFDFSSCLDLLEFLKQEFGGGWKRNALLAMRSGTAEDVILLAKNPDGNVCGFCMRAIDGNPMRFGPIGVSSKLQNKGIGSVLLDLQCFEMEKRGIYRMFFMTTNAKARRYYERHGLEVFRTYQAYQKQF